MSPPANRPGGPPAARAILIQPSELALPCPTSQLFGRSAPLGLDVGCGDGRFLARMATQSPEWNWLGVEASGAYVWRARTRLGRCGATNARLLHGTAGFAVRYLLPPSCLDAVYVNFPDPWPKSRHEERRLLRGPFLLALATRLVLHGRVYVTTDDASTVEFAAAEAERLELYAIHRAEPPPEVLTTKYAAKWLAAGRAIHHLRLELLTAAPAGEPPLTRYTVPHAILSGPLPKAVAFEKRVRELPAGHVVILEALCSLADDSLVLLGQVREPDLDQSLLIEARPHPEGVIVRLRRFGHPLITAGVRAAVGLVAEWLVEQGLTLRRRCY